MTKPLDLAAMKEHAKHCYPHAKLLSPEEFVALADRTLAAEVRIQELETRVVEAERDPYGLLLNVGQVGGVQPDHKVADEDGLAWVKALVQSAHPNTPCRLQVGFVRSLLERLEQAEAQRDDHLRNWTNAVHACDLARGERDRALPRAEAAEARLAEIEGEVTRG